MSEHIPSGVVGRMGRLTAASLKTSLRLGAAWPRAVLGRQSSASVFEGVHQATADELRDLLGRLKGAAMKVGQMASFVDAGVLPPAVRDLYQDALVSLLDAVPPMPPEQVAEVVRAELGGEPWEVFAAWKPEPAAAASLGQVHVAVLPDGREAAVKVQYPGIEEAVRSDLAMTRAVRPLLPLLAPGLDAEPALEEIRSRTLAECDYELEARNLAEVAERYEGHPFAWVPKPVPELTSRRVLTMERARGKGFASMRRRPKAERDRLGEMLFRFYWGSLHRFGITSADPHPGNYMLMDDGRLAFLDFGLSCGLEPWQSQGLLGLFQALQEGDADLLFERAVALGYVTRPDHVDPERFLEYARFSLAPIAEDRDYTFNRAFIAERTSAVMDPRDPWWRFVRQLNVPAWAVLVSRLEIGVFSVLAQLRSTANWHAITMELLGERKPATDLGRAEARWLASR